MDTKKQKRNYASEINALKERAEFHTRYDMFSSLNELREFADSIVEDNIRDKEFIKLFPIRLVAILESYFRSVVKSLIDHGDPFLKNVPKLNQPNDGKLSIELLLSINESEFTLGELIAHVLPCSKFVDIINALNILTEKDILKELKDYMPITIHEHNIEIACAYVSNEPLIKTDIFDIYRLRNIFCHELGITEEIIPAKIRVLVASMSFFINHLDNYIENLIYPNAPETNADIISSLGTELRQVEEKLTQIIDNIKISSASLAGPNFEINLFDNIQQHWEKFRDINCEMAAHSCEGGRLYSQLYIGEKITQTERRIRDLLQDFNYELEKYKKTP